MRIVKLPPDRWADYRQLRLDALRTDPKAYTSTYEGGLKLADDVWIGRLEAASVNPNKTLLFAEESGKLIGMVGAFPEEAPGIVGVVSMFVVPEARGRGVGQALLRAVVDEIEADEIRLSVNDGQAQAIALYERFGFVTIAQTSMTRSDGSAYVQFYMALRRAGH